MSEKEMHDVIFRAELGDRCSGLVRIVDDVQRFGFRLKTLILEDGDDQAAVATITLSIPYEADAGFIAMRLARHPSVASIEVRRDQSISRSLPRAFRQSDPRLTSEPVRSVMSPT